jgi:hypothetical protein
MWEIYKSGSVRDVEHPKGNYIMSTRQPADIGSRGEEIVENFFKGKGFETKRNTKFPGATDIEAHKNTKKCLVQVKTSQYPNEPNKMSSEEIRLLKSRASKLNCVPIRARLQIDGKGNLVGDIKFKRL